MKCPCKDCARKGCGDEHDTCERYQTWQVYNEDRRKWLQSQRPAMNEGAVKGGIKNIRDRARGWGKRKVKKCD